MVKTASQFTKSKQPISLKYYVTLNDKKYFYTLRPFDEESTWVECEAAGISQNFLHEDIPALLLDLPHLIISEKEYQKNQEEVVRFRLSAEDKQTIQKKAAKAGYASVSAFLRDLALSN